MRIPQWKDAIIIDASNQRLGRMASHVAKILLLGKKVIIVNADRAVISGDKRRIIERFKEMYEKTTLRNPMRLGHRNPRRPEMIVRKAIRGMLPRKKHKGRQALRRLRVYSGIPPEIKGKDFIRFDDADVKYLGRKYVYIGDIALLFGWKPPKTVVVKY